MRLIEFIDFPPGKNCSEVCNGTWSMNLFWARTLDGQTYSRPESQDLNSVLSKIILLRGLKSQQSKNTDPIRGANCLRPMFLSQFLAAHSLLIHS